jgi:hypothetical protein
MKRIAVEIDGSGTVLSARALHDEENPGPVEYEYVRADDRLRAVDTLREARLYSEKMIRDRDETVRRCGADLLSIIDHDAERR